MVALTKQKFLPLLIKAITPLRLTSKRLYVIAEIKNILPEKNSCPRVIIWKSKGDWKTLSMIYGRNYGGHPLRVGTPGIYRLESISSSYSYMYSISTHSCDELFDILLNLF